MCWSENSWKTKEKKILFFASIIKIGCNLIIKGQQLSSVEWEIIVYTYVHTYNNHVKYKTAEAIRYGLATTTFM